MEQLTHIHGGDLSAIELKYKIPKNEIIDFSGNINPLGFPESVRKALSENISIVSQYPDKNYDKLRESIGKYTNADPKYITVGNGSTELISTFIKSVNAKKSIILGPAYSEYEHEIALSGGEFEYFPLEETNNFMIDTNNLIKSLTPEIGLFIACNPNNPTGTAITVSQMELILLHCKKNNTYVMIDETYIEFSDNIDEICSIPLVEKFDNLFVIRGISKFFAAPGIRLGYGICSSQKFLKLLKDNQDPWSVNILASFAGEIMFTDTDFINKTKKLISDERKKALQFLNNIGCIKAYDSSANFILIKLLTDSINSDEIFENLISKKMLIRNAESFTFLDKNYIRFCILKPEQNEVLLRNLSFLVE